MSTMRSMARDMKRSQGTFKGAGRLKGHHNHCHVNRNREKIEQGKQLFFLQRLMQAIGLARIDNCKLKIGN